MRADASKYHQTQANATKHKQIQTHTTNYKLLLTITSELLLIKAPILQGVKACWEQGDTGKAKNDMNNILNGGNAERH